jgi:hypothetical protein
VYSTSIFPASLRLRVTRAFHENAGRTRAGVHRKALGEPPGWKGANAAPGPPAAQPTKWQSQQQPARQPQQLQQQPAARQQQQQLQLQLQHLTQQLQHQHQQQRPPQQQQPQKHLQLHTTTKASVAAARDTRAAAKKKAAGAAGIGAETTTSPSLPAPPAKRKRQRQPPSEPTSDMSAIADIPQLDGDGDVSVAGSDESSLLSTPPPRGLPATSASPTQRNSSPAPSPSMTPKLSPSNPASGNSKCCDCNLNVLFNYDFKRCLECLKKLICAKCFASSQEYRLKYSFKYILDYCQVECNR